MTFLPPGTLLGIVASIVSLTSETRGQTVAVLNGEGEAGYGWMFLHDGVCHAVLPEHVAGDFPEITVTSAAPVETGSGFVAKPFWPGIDLAVAVLRGGITDRCEGRLEDLDPDRTARSAVTAQLERLTPAGEVLRDPLRIGNVQYLTFEGRLDRPGSAIREGTSGAFAFAGAAPLGMALDQGEDDRTGIFMRADEIHMHVSRYLSEHAGSFGGGGATPETSAPAPGALALELLSVSQPPVNPRFAPERMLGEGIFVAAATGPVSAVFRVAGEGMPALSRLVVTAPADGEHALPRDILVEVSPTAEGARWFSFGRFRLAADGLLDTGARAPRNARRIRLTVLSADRDGPVAIGSVTAY